MLRLGPQPDRANGRPTRPRAWLSARHSLRVEVSLVLAFYALYEASRGLVAGDLKSAVHNAHQLVSIERSLHVFFEHDVQRAVEAVPGLIDTLGVLYLTLHLALTGGYLLWLHQRRPAAFPLVRTTLLVASGLALIGYLALPTAPPRLAGIGISDTVSNSHVDLNQGLISSLYNPVAAVPSMHLGYAVVVATSLLLCVRRATLRAAAALYPLLVLLVIVATGNHFFIDAVAGALTAAVAWGVAVAIDRPLATLEAQRRPGPAHPRQAIGNEPDAKCVPLDHDGIRHVGGSRAAA
jgi:PAP2 superfamily